MIFKLIPCTKSNTQEAYHGCQRVNHPPDTLFIEVEHERVKYQYYELIYFSIILWGLIHVNGCHECKRTRNEDFPM